MDKNKPDKTDNMVKLTIKRADDSTVDANWVCKSIDEEQESSTPMKMEQEAGETLTAQGENSKNKPEYDENWYQTIPSYLEIEMKEGKNLKQSRRNSTENNSIIDCPSSSHETIYNAATSINNPMDLSTSRLNQSDVTNVSNKSPPEAHTSHGKFLANVNAEVRSAHGLTRPLYHNLSSMWSPNILPMAIQRQITPGEEYAMSTMGRPITSYNFEMTPLGVLPAKMEKQEIPTEVNVLHMTQDAQKHQRINYNDDRANYAHYSNEPQSNANQSHRWSTGIVRNENFIPFRNVLPERKEDNFVNTQPRNATNVLKRLAENSVYLVRGGESKSAGPPMKKKPRDVPDVTKYCNVCEKQFKTEFNYNNHLLTKKHLKKAEQIALKYSNNPLKSNSHPNFEGGPSEQKNLQPPPLLLPPELQLLHLQMWHKLQQAQEMTSSRLLDNEHQSIASKESIDSNVVQNRGPETSKTNYNAESLNQFRSQNFDGKDCYPQNPRHMNLPFSPTCNSRIVSPPRHLSENSMFANSKNLETKAPNSSRAYEDISVQIQPERLNVAIYPHNPSVSHTNNPQRGVLPTNSQSVNSMSANPENLQSTAPHSSRAYKDNKARIQPEGLPVANSSKKNVGVQSVTHHQEDTFRIYHCIVCSIFKTSSWQELQRHIYADRSRTPLDLIIPFSAGLLCKLCNFRTKLSAEMAEHCTSRSHVDRVSYYNHLREGGVLRTGEAFKNSEKSFWVFCVACEYAAISMDILHAHAASQMHQFNVSCCLYIESFSSSTEYYACLPCSLKTLTKMDLLKHARSNEHKKVLEKFLCGDMFPDPRLLFFCKELSVPPKISEQNAASTFIGREEKNEESKIADNLSSLNLGSASSTSLQPRPVICFLCQQPFAKIGFLESHLHKCHGVNEAGIKWVVSVVTKEDSTVHEVKSLREKVISGTKAPEVKSSTFGADESSAKNMKLKRKSNDICLQECSVVTEQQVAINENLNPLRTSNACSSHEIKGMQNLGKQDENPILNLCEGVYSNQELHETDGIHNVDILDQNLGVNSRGRTSLAGSLRHEFYETESRQLADDLDQNSQVNPRKRASLDDSLRQEFHQIKNEQNAENLDQNSSLNPLGRTTSDDSLNQVFQETVGEQNADNRHQNSQVYPLGKTSFDFSLSQEFRKFEGELNSGNLYQNPSLNPRGIAYLDGSLSQEFHKTEDRWNAANVLDQNPNLKVLNSLERLNSNSPQRGIKIENEAESDDDNILVIETDVDSSGLLSSTDTGSLISHSVFNTSIESNGSWSNDDISEPYKRLPETEKPISSAGRREIIDSPSNQNVPMDSENSQLISDCQPNLDFERNEVSNSSTINVEDAFGPKVNDDNVILVKIENSDCLLNSKMESNESEVQLDAQLRGGMASNDCPNESEMQLNALLRGGMAWNDCPTESEVQLDAPLRGGMESNDCPNESEVQLDASLNGGMESNESEEHAQHLLAETDPQIAAEENIKNIEISGFFSLRDHIDYSSKDEGETDGIDIYRDL